MPLKIRPNKSIFTQWNKMGPLLALLWYVVWFIENKRDTLSESVLVTILIHALGIVIIGLGYHLFVQMFAKNPNRLSVIIGFWVGNILSASLFIAFLYGLLIFTDWWFVGVIIGLVQGYFLSIPLSLAVLQQRIPEKVE